MLLMLAHRRVQLRCVEQYVDVVSRSIFSTRASGMCITSELYIVILSPPPLKRSLVATVSTYYSIQVLSVTLDEAEALWIGV